MINTRVSCLVVQQKVLDPIPSMATPLWARLPEDIHLVISTRVLADATTPKEIVRRYCLLIAIGKTAMSPVIVARALGNLLNATPPRRDFDLERAFSTCVGRDLGGRIEPLARGLVERRLTSSGVSGGGGNRVCALTSLVTLGAAPPSMLYQTPSVGFGERFCAAIESAGFGWLKTLPPNTCVWCGDAFVHTARHRKNVPPLDRAVMPELCLLGATSTQKNTNCVKVISHLAMRWGSALRLHAHSSVPHGGTRFEMHGTNDECLALVFTESGADGAGVCNAGYFMTHQRAYADVPSMAIRFTEVAGDAWRTRSTRLHEAVALPAEMWRSAEAIGFIPCEVVGRNRPFRLENHPPFATAAVATTKWIVAARSMRVCMMPEVLARLYKCVVCPTMAHWRAALKSGAVREGGGVVVTLRPYKVSHAFVTRHDKLIYPGVELQVPFGERIVELQELATLTAVALGCEVEPFAPKENRQHVTFSVGVGAVGESMFPSAFSCNGAPMKTVGRTNTALHDWGNEVCGMVVATVLLTKGGVQETELEVERGVRNNVFHLDMPRTAVRLDVVSNQLMY